MKRKLRIFSHIAIICLSVCMFAFGVYAASSVNVTTSGTVTFTADNVNATVTRTVTGHDATKSTVNANYTKEINTETTPEGALHTIEDLKNERLVFVDENTPIVMTFTITNNSTDRNLKYVLGGSATGTGIKTKLMTGDRLILINDDNYLDPYVEDDDAFVNETTITITFTVADANSSCELAYNYNLDLSVVKPIVSDNFTITSTNATYGSAVVEKKVGNTLKINTAVNNNGQFFGFTTTQNGVELVEEFCGYYYEKVDYYDELKGGTSMLRVLGITEVSSVTANISQIDTSLYKIGDYLGYGYRLACVNSSTFNVENVVVPQLVNINANIAAIGGIDVNECKSIKSLTLPITNAAMPNIYNTSITSLRIPRACLILSYNQYLLDFSGSTLYFFPTCLEELYLDDIGNFSGDYNAYQWENDIGFQGGDSLRVLYVSPYNPHYYSVNNNMIINANTNTLVWACNPATEVPDGIEVLGKFAFFLVPSSYASKTIVIPTSVKKIYNYNFDNHILSSIRYLGTQAQWNAVQILGYDGSIDSIYNSGWETLTVQCTDGNIVYER